VAAFSGLTLDTAGTGYTLKVSSGTLSATTSAITVTPATPAKLVLAAKPPASLTAGASLGLTVDVEDPYGNLTAFSGSVSVAIASGPSGGTLGGQTAVTASGGIATFTGLTLTQAGSYTLQVSGGSLTAAATGPIAVSPAAPSQLVVTTPPPGSLTAGVAFGLAITAEDQYGNPTPAFIGSVTVSSGSSPLGGTTTVTASEGIADFSGLTLDQAGTDTLDVSSNGLSPAVTAVITVTPAAAVQLIVTSEPPGSVTAGAGFGLTVEAEDPFGNLATAFDGSVTAVLSAGGGKPALVGPAAVVASGGVAAFTGLTVDQAGSGYTLQLTSGSLAAATTSAFSVTPAGPAQLVIATQPPASLTAGDPFSLSVSVVDPYGNLATNYDGPVTIALSNHPAGSALGGTLTAQAANGLAAFPGLVLDTAGSGYTITAASGRLSTATTGSIDVAAAAATQLAVSIPPPSRMTAGAEFGLAIAAEDPFGNLATGFTGNVTITLATNPGNATLLGRPLTVAVAGGVANFPAFLTIDTAGSGYTLQAASAGLTAATSSAMTVIPAPATHLVVLIQPPASLVPGGSFELVAAAEDPFGNVDPTFGGEISVAPAGGSGVTLGGSTTVTASQGVAAFSGLTLSQSSQPVSLQVTSAGLTGTTTNPASVTPPAQLAFTAGSVTVNENAGAARIQVVRSGGLLGTVSVDVATSGGTAVAGVNYTPVNQVLTFAAGQASQIITIPVKDDGVVTPDLTVNLVLSSPGAGAVLGSPALATLVIHNVDQTTTSPSSPWVTMNRVQLLTNQKHQVAEVIVGFSGGVNPARAQNPAEYRLAFAGRNGSFTARNARRIKLRSAVYNSTTDTVTLTPKKPFALTKPVELQVNGTAPSGLTDDLGRLIDGHHDGQPGGDAVAVLRLSGATIGALVGGPLSVVRRYYLV
jgi:hypothetical protein